MLCVLGCAVSVPVPAAATGLDPFVGRFLGRKHLASGERSALSEVIGTPLKEFPFGPDPWYVWRANRQDVASYIVLLVKEEFDVPGSSSACVLLFDGKARRISDSCFRTGYRLSPNNASLQFSQLLARDVVVFQTTRFINGANIAKEYFAIIGDQVRLIRLEDDKGSPAPNPYYETHRTIGATAEIKTVDQWISMLESQDRTEVLSALLYLGGLHYADTPSTPTADALAEVQDEHQFWQLYRNPRIRRLITNLTHSDNQWVRDAASLAASDPEGRWRSR